MCYSKCYQPLLNPYPCACEGHGLWAVSRTIDDRDGGRLGSDSCWGERHANRARSVSIQGCPQVVGDFANSDTLIPDTVILEIEIAALLLLEEPTFL